MRKTAIVIIIVLCIFNLSCSQKTKQKPLVENKEKPGSETLFKCRKRSIINLQLNEAPLETSAGYMRLMGILKGSGETAVLEIGGKCFTLKTGEMLSGFIVKEINEKGVLIWQEN